MVLVYIYIYYVFCTLLGTIHPIHIGVQLFLLFEVIPNKKRVVFLSDLSKVPFFFSFEKKNEVRKQTMGFGQVGCRKSNSWSVFCVSNSDKKGGNGTSTSCSKIANLGKSYSSKPWSPKKTCCPPNRMGWCGSVPPPQHPHHVHADVLPRKKYLVWFPLTVPVGSMVMGSHGDFISPKNPRGEVKCFKPDPLITILIFRTSKKEIVRSPPKQMECSRFLRLSFFHLRYEPET